MKRRIAGLVAAVLAAVAATLAVAEVAARFSTERHAASVELYCPPVVAHRGAGAGYPVETRSAFVTAALKGARVLELDVRYTRDGNPMVLHDADLDRTTDGTGPIAAMPLSELRSTVIVDGMAGKWAPYVPTLFEVLSGSAPYVDRFLIEVKTWPTSAQADATIARIDSAGVWDRVVIASFSAPVLEPFRAAGLRTALIGYTERVPVATAAAAGDVFLPHFGTVDVEYVAELVAAGISEVYPWTANDPAEWAAMAEAGVTGTITDRTADYVRSACRENIVT